MTFLKYSINSFFDRFLAIILLLCMTVVAVCGVLGIVYLRQYNFYTVTDRGSTAKEVAIELYVDADAQDAKKFFKYSQENDEQATRIILQTYIDRFSVKKSNFFFTVSDLEGNVIFDSYGVCSGVNTDTYTEDMLQYSQYEVVSYSDIDGTRTEYLFNYCVLDEEHYAASDHYSSAFRWINLAYTLRFVVFFIVAVAALVIVYLLSQLACSAGAVDDSGKIVPGFIDQLPFDLCTVFFVSICIASGMTISLANVSGLGMVVNNLVVVIASVIIMIMLLTFLSTLVTRIKIGKLWKNTIVYRLLLFTERLLRRKIKFKRPSISFFRQLIASVAAVFLGEVGTILFFAYRYFVVAIDRGAGAEAMHYEYFILIWIITRLIFIPIVVMLSLNLYYVRESGKRLAAGDLTESILDKISVKQIRSHGENLEQIRKEISKAIEQELISERMKSELITNVSHDIRTPVTSIISYAKLLDADNVSPEATQQYIAGILRQSENLDKLLESLIVASKAASGDINIEFSITSINLLIEQTIFEFENFFREKELEPVISLPPADVCVNVDGNLTWRVFSNLLNNIGKYALKQSQVHISVECADGRVRIIFKNTSESAIQKDKDELMQRFVRDDASRHTKGNGLGLSIARDLTLLQNGTFDIEIKDDVFTTIITFEEVKE